MLYSGENGNTTSFKGKTWKLSNGYTRACNYKGQQCNFKTQNEALRFANKDKPIESICEVKIPPGFRKQLYGDKTPTHFICRKHGRLVPAGADDHSCTWIPLVKETNRVNEANFLISERLNPKIAQWFRDVESGTRQPSLKEKQVVVKQLQDNVPHQQLVKMWKEIRAKSKQSRVLDPIVMAAIDGQKAGLGKAHHGPTHFDETVYDDTHRTGKYIGEGVRKYRLGHLSQNELDQVVGKLVKQGYEASRIGSYLRTDAPKKVFDEGVYQPGQRGSVKEPKSMPARSAFDAIKPGSRVTIKTPQGQTQRGKAVMYNRQHDSWALNMGGAHGRPGVATRDNFVSLGGGGSKMNRLSDRPRREAVDDRSVPGKYTHRVSTGKDAVSSPRSNPPNFKRPNPADEYLMNMIKKMGLRKAERWFKQNPRGIGYRARSAWPIYHDRFQKYKKQYAQWANQRGLKERVVNEGPQPHGLRGGARVTTTRDINHKKSGKVIPKGTSLEMKFTPLAPAAGYVEYEGHWMLTQLRLSHNSFRGIGKPPSMRQLEKMVNDGIAKSVTGKRVEPDGHGPDGSPSWLLVLGMI